MQNNNIIKEIGLKIRSVRNLRHISLVKMSQMLGISRRQLQNYEKGLNDIKVARLYEIAKIMNVDLAFFFDETSSLSEDSEEFLDILSNFARIKDAKIRESICDLLKELSNN